MSAKIKRHLLAVELLNELAMNPRLLPSHMVLTTNIVGTFNKTWATRCHQVTFESGCQ
jgi:hypothetical protein